MPAKVRKCKNRRIIYTLKGNLKMMIMKRLLFMTTLAMLSLGMAAKPLTPRQAIERTVSGRMCKGGQAQLKAEPVYTQLSEKGTPTVYVFNRADGKGFRILSADDAAYPVLGYSDSGSIDPDNIAPAFREWIEGLGSQISSASGGETVPETSPGISSGNREMIPPMISTHWHQEKPYNGAIPVITVDGEDRTSNTGSAAVAMAQLMNYFEYPRTGQGEVSYVWTHGWSEEDKTQLEMDLSTFTFDWDSMLDNYGEGTYTREQADAVAALMYAAGLSVSTQWNKRFGADTSACTSMACSLREHFGYDGATSFARRSMHPAAEWEEMIYDNLKNVGPVIMWVGSNYYPWAFICDGYDGDGYFHFNWGCGGNFDGYYLMTALNPLSDGNLYDGVQGSIFSLAAVFGAQPPAGNVARQEPDNIMNDQEIILKLIGGHVYFDIGRVSNAMDHPVRLAGGVIIEPMEGTPGETAVKRVLIDDRMELSLPTAGSTPMSGSGLGPLKIGDLPDGRYRLTGAVRDLNSDDSPYVPILGGYRRTNYGFLNIKDGVPSVENTASTPGDHELEVVGVEVLSPIYSNRNSRFRIRLRNSNDIDVTEGLRIKLLDPYEDYDYLYGYEAYSSCLFTVPANSEKDFDVCCEFSEMLYQYKVTLPQQYVLAITEGDKEIGRFGNVTVYGPMERSELTCSGMKINDCPTEEEEVNGETVPVYIVPNEKFSASAEYRVGPGYFDSTLSFGVYRHNSIDPDVLDPVALGLYREQQFMDGDVDGSVTGDIDFTEGRPGELYMLVLKYTFPLAMWDFGIESKEVGRVYFRLQTSGIKDVCGGADGTPAVYYNLQGIRILNPEKGQTVIRVKDGGSQKVIF